MGNQTRLGLFDSTATSKIPVARFLVAGFHSAGFEMLAFMAQAMAANRLDPSQMWRTSPHAIVRQQITSLPQHGVAKFVFIGLAPHFMVAVVDENIPCSELNSRFWQSIHAFGLDECPTWMLKRLGVD